jgi:hypothetical protein
LITMSVSAGDVAADGDVQISVDGAPWIAAGYFNGSVVFDVEPSAPASTACPSATQGSTTSLPAVSQAR